MIDWKAKASHLLGVRKAILDGDPGAALDTIFEEDEEVRVVFDIVVEMTALKSVLVGRNLVTEKEYEELRGRCQDRARSQFLIGVKALIEEHGFGSDEDE